MYKVFLVEDEVVIRKGIKNSIQWEKEGFVFAGEASDGELALPLIRKEKPDILITDIRMPFMDGLELSRLVRKDMPRIKIIILSGFNEFEYAKTAIDLGITQYLLKPINSAQLLEAVRKVAGQIDREREIEALVERDRLETEENRMREQNILFQHLVTGSYSTQELLDMADALQVRLSAPWYNIILLKIHSLHHADTEYSPTVIEIEEKMKQLCEQAGFILFDRNLEGKALLVRADTARELKEKQEQYVSALRSVLQVYPHVRYFGGIGKCVNRLHLLSESYEEASRCFAHRYLVSDNLFLESQSLAQEGLGSDSVALQDLDVRGLDRGRILEFLRTGDRGETKYFVGEFFRELKGSAMKSAMFRQYVAMDTYFCVAGFLEELGLDRSELELPENVADQFQGEETTLQYMVDLMEKALELRENAAG